MESMKARPPYLSLAIPRVWGSETQLDGLIEFVLFFPFFLFPFVFFVFLGGGWWFQTVLFYMHKYALTLFTFLINSKFHLILYDVGMLCLFPLSPFVLGLVSLMFCFFFKTDLVTCFKDFNLALHLRLVYLCFLLDYGDGPFLDNPLYCLLGDL